jgi:hypothetical protein
LKAKAAAIVSSAAQSPGLYPRRAYKNKVMIAVENRFLYQARMLRDAQDLRRSW